MPRLSQYFVKSALICLLLGFVIGGLLLAVKAGLGDGRVWLWFSAHIALLLNGWLIQLTLGVAYWILPRILAGDRGRIRWAWASFFCLQAGLVLTVLSLAQIIWPDAQYALAPGAALQALAILLFAVHAWPRIRPTLIRAQQESA